MKYQLIFTFILAFVCLCNGGPSSNPNPVSPASVQIVQNLFNDMLARWQVLDNNCDPDAVFALTYMYMTNGVKKLMQQGYFDDGNSMATFTKNFAKRYTDAYDAYKQGNYAAVSSPWKVAFDFAASGYSNVSQNLFLGMNAHINYDLAIAAWQSGFYTLARKSDYNRINDLMSLIQANISSDIGLRYDNLLSNAPDVLNYGVLALIVSWRSVAYLEMQEYYLFPFTRQLNMDINQAAAYGIAQLVAIPNQQSTAPDRIAHCTANHAPSRI